MRTTYSSFNSPNQVSGSFMRTLVSLTETFWFFCRIGSKPFLWWILKMWEKARCRNIERPNRFIFSPLNPTPPGHLLRGPAQAKIYIRLKPQISCPTAQDKNKRQHFQIPGAQNAVRARGSGHGSGRGVARRSQRQRQRVTIWPGFPAIADSTAAPMRTPLLPPTRVRR